MFDKWLKDCPVIYYLSEPLKGDEKIVQFTFEKNRRRK